MNGCSAYVSGVQPFDMTRQASASVFQQGFRPRRRGYPTSRKEDALAAYSVRAVFTGGLPMIAYIADNNNIKRVPMPRDEGCVMIPNLAAYFSTLLLLYSRLALLLLLTAAAAVQPAMAG